MSGRSRFDEDPTVCILRGGHFWRDDMAVIDTSPELHTQYCVKCPAYRTRGGIGNDPFTWSLPKVHPRFEQG